MRGEDFAGRQHVAEAARGIAEECGGEEAAELLDRTVLEEGTGRATGDDEELVGAHGSFFHEDLLKGTLKVSSPGGPPHFAA